MCLQTFIRRSQYDNNDNNIICVYSVIEAGASVYIFHIVRSTQLRLHWYKFYKELAKIRVQIPHAVKMNNNNNSCTKWDMKNDEKKSTNAHNRVLCLCVLDGCAGSSLFTHTHIIVYNIYKYACSNLDIFSTWLDM